MNENLNTKTRQKIVVIGGGPVGSLAAIYAAQRNYDVELYELRGDLRDPSITPLNFTKSINLALSERGINALRHSQRSYLVKKILDKSIPMKARMIHGRSKSGTLYEESQDYDIYGKTIFAVERSALNARLLDELETLPNVKIFFDRKLVSIDFDSHKAILENNLNLKNCCIEEKREKRTETYFDLLIGADGAHSAVRQHMMKHTCMDYSQSYVDTLWCEFTIKAKSTPSTSQFSQPIFQISPNHLHIWPGKEYMFIAIPSLSGDFVCTLFAPSSIYRELSNSSEALLEFFHQNFPGVTPDLIPAASIIESFSQNPHLPLISIKCSPHHFQDSVVIIGDATHAMVPFYGQGMNAGFEDVRVLFQTLDKYTTQTYFSSNPRAFALEQYSALRTVDSEAITRLALENYLEMRSSVTSYMYKFRKSFEEKLNLWFPGLGWATKYSRVSFGNERYSEVIRKTEHQGKIINRLVQCVGMIALSGVFWSIFAAKRKLSRVPI